MFDLGFLKEEQLSRISREELMARNPDHSQPENRRPATQGRDAGSPIESEPARNVSQPPLAIATVFDWDEFNGEFPEDIHRPEPEGPDRRSNSKTDLYLRNPRDDCLTDAAAAASMHVDLPSDKLVLKKAGPDHLRLTESGVSALGDVSMIVREADGSYGLVRSERIKARSFEEWTAKHGRDGVFLRDGNDFLSVDRYNSTHNTKYKPDAAGGRFAAISGRSSRGDLPQLMIEDDEGDFVEIHDYLSRAGSRSLKERNIIIPSANGKALHSPWVSEKQNRLYFAGLTTDEQVLRLLGCYDRYSHRRKPLPPVLVLVDGKLVNGEKLNVLDHLYAPFVERHPEENLFLQNHENGRLTGNYKILNKYSKPTLEQDQIIGQHPQTEQERRAQIPPIVDPVRPVAEIPPGTDDPYIASKPAGEDAARRRGLDRTQHSRSRSR
jgi:hypothetical protein